MTDGITPLAPQQQAEQEQRAAAERYIERCLVGLDQFVNILTDGDPDETISSRSARAAEKGKPWGIAISRFLDIFQRDHGAKAQAGDVARGDKVVKLEEASGGFAEANRAKGDSSGGEEKETLD